MTLWQVASTLSHRLHEETLALDRQDNETKKPTPILEIKSPTGEDETRRAAWRVRTQLALFELAGVAENRLRPIRQELERVGVGRSVKTAAP